MKRVRQRQLTDTYIDRPSLLLSNVIENLFASAIEGIIKSL